MSIRPKRRAAYQQNYNEDDLFLEQTYIEHPPIKSQPVSPHRFVEPRNRIPQQRVQQDAFLRHPKRPQMKRFSLKTYLTAKIPSKRVKTRLCGSKRLSLVDMRSYDEILSSKRRIIQNKRRRKEDLKNVGIQLEKEKHFSQVFSPDFGVHGTSQSLLDSNFVPMNFHAQGITEYERANYSKVARDPVNNSKRV